MYGVKQYHVRRVRQIKEQQRKRTPAPDHIERTPAPLLVPQSVVGYVVHTRSGIRTYGM